MARVRVHRGGDWDVRVVERTLGVVPHVVPPVTAPVISIDGVVENDASAWLREVDARSGPRKTRTATTRADSLRSFLHYITAQNTCNTEAQQAPSTAFVGCLRLSPSPLRVLG